MDEARSLTYSINVRADTSQAESSIRGLVSGLGDTQNQRINIRADTSQAESNVRNLVGSVGKKIDRAQDFVRPFNWYINGYNERKAQGGCSWHLDRSLFAASRPR